MGYKAEPPLAPDDVKHRDGLAGVPEFSCSGVPAAPERERTPLWPKTRESVRSEGTESEGDAGSTPERADLDWL